jgi:IS30 family transposase
VQYIDCAQRIKRTAQVCNGCPDEKSCHRRKLFYVAVRAHEDYRKVLCEHRQGAALEDWERQYIDELVSPKIKAGQSVHHICVTNAPKLTRNERTIQRYVNYGILSAKRGDLKRACMVRSRKALAKEYQHKVETGCYVNRTYKDYERFIAEHPGIAPVYMDLVIGRPGGVCLLTLHWLNAGFMIGILIPNKCAESVVNVFDRLYEELGHELFTQLFQVILTDRGTEFSNPSRIELNQNDVRRTWVFFCDPMNSNQKSQLERNHELVREILPKGVSFDSLTQEQAYLALSHVNAYIRYVNGNRTPYEVFEFLYGKGMAAKLHIENIDPREVILKPRLVGIEMK